MHRYMRMKNSSITQYSPVGPIHILELLKDVGQLGDYLLFISNDVLMHEDRYRKLVNDIDPFIIMDNGVIETGSASPINQVVAAADIVNANCIIGPDVLGDLHGTKAAYWRSLEEASAAGYFMMMLPQGKNALELYDCIAWMHCNIKGHYWGIPRWIANNIGTREFVIEEILHHDPDAFIHLLGMSQRFDDDILCAKHPQVVGIDSANPLVMGIAGYGLGNDTHPHLDRGDYWIAGQLNPLAIQNIEWLRKRLN